MVVPEDQQLLDHVLEHLLELETLQLLQHVLLLLRHLCCLRLIGLRLLRHHSHPNVRRVVERDIALVVLAEFNLHADDLNAVHLLKVETNLVALHEAVGLWLLDH